MHRSVWQCCSTASSPREANRRRISRCPTQPPPLGACARFKAVAMKNSQLGFCRSDDTLQSLCVFRNSRACGLDAHTRFTALCLPIDQRCPYLQSHSQGLAQQCKEIFPNVVVYVLPSHIFFRRQCRPRCCSSRLRATPSRAHWTPCFGHAHFTRTL